MNLAVAGLALLALFLVIALLAVGGVLLVRVLDDQVPPPRTAWREGYEQGVSDERTAAAVDWPEYRQPNRQNPYEQEAEHGDR